MPEKLYQLGYYVPESAHETLKQHLFAAGAGRYKNYEQCCWQVLGESQFLPQTNSQPKCGEVGKLYTNKEYKVEMICQQQYLKPVIETLLCYHPYEQPAYHVLPMLQPADWEQ